MALTPEQVEEIRQQLREQVQNLPEEKKQQALVQIDSLSPQAIELMVKQQQSKGSGEKEKTIFRMIVDREIPTVILSENKYALAVLDINPISRGHTMIIPKKPVSDAKQLPTQAFGLAKKLAKRAAEKLKAKSSEIQTESKFGEVIINLIPCYDSPLNINSPRTKSSIEELEKVAPLMKDKPKPIVQKIKIAKPKSSGNQPLKLQRRIP